MKRRMLLGSLVGLVVFLGLATAAAAVFLPRSRWTGMKFTTSNLGLQISRESVDNPTAGSFMAEVDQYESEQLTPGGLMSQYTFWVKNLSNRVVMDLSGQLLTGNGDWELLKNVIQISLADYVTPTEVTPWYTLDQWQASPQPFPGSMLRALDKKRYILRVRVVDKYPNGTDVGEEIFNKSTGNVTFIISGAEHQFPNPF
jgi:hypothetical protein